MAGGGELVELMKKATKTKDYNELDETIKAKVTQYTYNNGAGKSKPIHDFVLRRNKERPPSKQVSLLIIIKLCMVISYLLTTIFIMYDK